MQPPTATASELQTVGLFEAKTHLSAIVDRVHKTGQPILITRRGEPMVRITPVPDDSAARRARRARMFEEVAARHAAERAAGVVPPTAEEIRADIEDGRA